MSELRPSELLYELLQSADAAGQSDEPVRQIKHQHFALVKSRGHIALIDGLKRVLNLQKRGMNNPGNVAIVVTDGLRDGPQQSVDAAAVNTADSGFLHGAATRCSRF